MASDGSGFDQSAAVPAMTFAPEACAADEELLVVDLDDVTGREAGRRGHHRDGVTDAERSRESCFDE